MRLSINTSCHRTYCSYITAPGASAVLPCDHCPTLSQRGNRNFTSVQHQALDTSNLPTLHIPLLCTCAPLGLADKFIHMYGHTQPECIFLCCTCVHARMHTQIQASHLFSLCSTTLSSLSPLCITNVAAKMFPQPHCYFTLCNISGILIILAEHMLLFYFYLAVKWKDLFTPAQNY